MEKKDQLNLKNENALRPLLSHEHSRFLSIIKIFHNKLDSSNIVAALIKRICNHHISVIVYNCLNYIFLHLPQCWLGLFLSRLSSCLTVESTLSESLTVMTRLHALLLNSLIKLQKPSPVIPTTKNHSFRLP